MLDPTMVPKSWGRSGSRWKAVRKAAFERDRDANAPCWICGRPINYAGDSKTDPWAWQPDHVLTVKQHPEFALDITNIKPSHARCNNQRAKDDRAKPANDNKRGRELGEPSEDWGI